MGIPNLNDGSIERADLDGGNHRMIVPEGGTFTPKQLHLDKKNGKLYWSDREGMRVMRSNLDGSKIETLVQTGQGEADRRDPMKWCVGITVDAEREQIYWTQKGPDDALQEGIGIALDLKGERMFLTDLGGSLYSAKLNGSDKKTLLYAQGNLTGIAYAELPSSKLVRIYQ
jgi:hypothetical protein